MSSEKTLGALFIIGSIIVMILYIIWGLIAPLTSPTDMMSWRTLSTPFGEIPVPPLYWLLFLPILAVILMGGAILSWIGWALIQTPSPEEIDIEEIEKQLEELEKEEEEKEEAEAPAESPKEEVKEESKEEGQ